MSRGIAVDAPCSDDVQWSACLDLHPASAVASSGDVDRSGKCFLILLCLALRRHGFAFVRYQVPLQLERVRNFGHETIA